MGGNPVGYLQKRDFGFENGATMKQIQVVPAGLEPWASWLQVCRPNL